MYNSTLNQGFVLHMVDSTTMVLVHSKWRLFFSDVKSRCQTHLS